MASLLNIIQGRLKPKTKVVNVNGQLQEITEEELQNVSQAMGRPTPTTPLSAATLGVSPDSAKMAGTKANIQRTNINEAEDFATQKARAQSRTEMTADEAARKQSLAQLGGLSGLGQWVQQLTSSSLSAQQPVEAKLTIDPAAIQAQYPELTPEQLAQLTPYLERVGAGTATSSDLLAINQALGKRDVSQQLGEADIKRMFLGEAASVGTGIAGAASDNIFINQFTDEQLGVPKAQLSQLLNIPLDQLDEMSVGALQAEIERLKRDEYSRVEELKRRATDPSLGVAEREEARRLLSEAGATGVRGVEGEFEELTSQVASASTITFGPKSYTVEELLSDDVLSGIVKEYIDTPESEYSQKLRETEPEFVKWIEAHRNALREATAGLDESVKQFAEIQAENAKLGQLGNGIQISDDVMKLLVPGFGELSATKYNEPEILKILKNELKDPTIQNNIATGLTYLYEVSPELVKEIAALGRPELLKLGIFDAGALQNYTNYVNRTEAINSINPEEFPEEMLNNIFGMGSEDLGELWSDAFAAESSGLASVDDSLLALLDADGDGKMDSLTDIRINYLKNNSSEGVPLNLTEMIQKGIKLGAVGSTEKAGIQSLSKQASAVDKPGTLLNKVASYYKDGHIDAKEARLLSSSLSLPELSMFLTKGQNIDSAARKTLQQKLNDSINSIFSGIISGALSGTQRLDSKQTLKLLDPTAPPMKNQWKSFDFMGYKTNFEGAYYSKLDANDADALNQTLKKISDFKKLPESMYKSVPGLKKKLDTMETVAKKTIQIYKLFEKYRAIISADPINAPITKGLEMGALQTEIVKLTQQIKPLWDVIK